MSRYHDILQQYWGYTSFRGIQEEIINSIGSGRDTLGLMPTGGGKSITFQVPALAHEGLCLVITPLIALMKDQVNNLRSRGIKAAAIYTGLTRDEIIVALENCIYGEYKFLYISPERLSSDLFLTKLKRIPVSMITVDESHCISQWGYDFRPAYLKIADIRKLLPDVPVLALTATATPEVVKDIQVRLGFKQENVFRMSFERENLAYVVRPTDSKVNELIHILQRIPGSAIVYTRSRNRTREVAEFLRQQGITAEFYHAGLPNVDKDIRQGKWQRNESRVMVATNAFGMGIDEPDVRLVAHVDLPDSPEAYFQEAGRAGRDGAFAYAVLLVSSRDAQTLKQRIPNTYPDKEFIRQVYEHLSYYYQLAMGSGEGVTYEFDLEKFCHNFKHFPVPVDSALRILTQAGYIEYVDEQENASRLMFTVRRDELYGRRDDADTENLLRVLMRTYTGLFTDYVYIDEHLLAHHAGLNYHRVYEILKSLNFNRIIRYIPHKKTPLIRYVQRREDKDRLVIPKSVYEERKSAYESRIGAMIEYATSTNKCRSRLLLYYFGEKNEHDCGQCDVCLSNHPTGLKRGVFSEVRLLLEKLLNEREGTLPLLVFMEEAETFCSREKAVEVLRYLQGEELIRMDGELICLPS
ncbi:MAG: RecQ family ATP-dependent DNA helicase [Bacteroidaceae bacterium]|nr:RecQ family ATP-dependent DNA helicase [Bacteroidaceae bacterium]